ncbi:MAG: hypothetical protein KDB14_09550 [Planctomycetales bacterium]|nr:hypothetical protein [Planctomycetales bacterium]
MPLTMYAATTPLTLGQFMELLPPELEGTVEVKGGVMELLMVRDRQKGSLAIQISVQDDDANSDTIQDMQGQVSGPPEFEDALREGRLHFVLVTSHEAYQASVDELIRRHADQGGLQFDTTDSVKKL